jgi:hypothetical protein
VRADRRAGAHSPKKIQHFFHLAAIYDLTASAAEQQAANIDGTQHALDLAAALKVKCFHHASSIAAAGLYPGVFREDMFDEAEGLDDPYLRTKHDSEAFARRSGRVADLLAGHGGALKTGDGQDRRPYYFTFLEVAREMLPPWMPTLGTRWLTNMCRSISSPTRSTTSRTSPSSTGIASTSPTRSRCG